MRTRVLVWSVATETEVKTNDKMTVADVCKIALKQTHCSDELKDLLCDYPIVHNGEQLEIRLDMTEIYHDLVPNNNYVMLRQKAKPVLSKTTVKP